MDILPDFSNSKIEIRSRIEGAIREKKKRPTIYQYSIFFCFLFITTTCTAFFIKNIFIFGEGSNKNIDYYTLEQLLNSDLLESKTTIELPSDLSLFAAGESTLVTHVDYLKENYE